jgi:hypothetical protein
LSFSFSPAGLIEKDLVSIREDKRKGDKEKQIEVPLS